MNWLGIGKAVETVAPIIGGILTGGVGTAITAVGSLVAHALGVGNSPDAVDKALSSDPQALAKVRQAELDNAVQLQKLATEAAANALAADTARIQAVNETMRTEAGSSHWTQWFWRPFNGLLFAPAIIAVYFVLPILGIRTPDVPTDVWVMWGSVLGVVAWHTGVKERIQAGDKATAGSALGAAVGKIISALPGKS